MFIKCHVIQKLKIENHPHVFEWYGGLTARWIVDTRGGRAREKEKKEAEAEVEEEGEGKGREGGHVIINVALHCSSQPM